MIVLVNTTTSPHFMGKPSCSTYDHQEGHLKLFSVSVQYLFYFNFSHTLLLR